MTPIDLPAVLRRCWSDPPATRGNFARENAESIAAAASMGWITTRIGVSEFIRNWRITPAGLSHLWALEALDE